MSLEDLPNKEDKMVSGAPPMSPEGGVGNGVGVAEAPRSVGSASRKESPVLEQARQVADNASRTAAASDEGGGKALRNILDFKPDQMTRINAAMDRIPVNGVRPAESTTRMTGSGPVRPPEASAASEPEAQNNQATDAQVEAALDAAARQQVADRRQRIDEFKSWTTDQVAEEIAVYERRLNMANGMMQKGSPPETQRLGQEQFRKAQDRLDELRNAQREAPGNERTTGGETDVDRARREVQARLDYNQKLSEMTVGQLNTQSQLEQGNLTDLESMLHGPLTRAEKDAITEKIRDTKARIDTVDKYKSLKEPTEKEQQTKSETEARQAEEQKEQEELISARETTASASDIENFRNNISTINEDVSSFEQQLAELERMIVAAEGDKTLKGNLIERRREMRKNLVDARNRLKTYESALKTATERQRAEAGPDAAIDTETLQPMTNAQYEKLTPEQKQTRLQELVRALPSLTPELYKEFQDKIKKGENLSQNELGQFVGYARDRLMAGDKKMLKDVYALNGRYSEVASSVIAAINATEEGNKLLGEMVHGKLEKIMKNKGLLMMLLALIAAIVAAGARVAGQAVFGEKK